MFYADLNVTEKPEKATLALSVLAAPKQPVLFLSAVWGTAHILLGVTTGWQFSCSETRFRISHVFNELPYTKVSQSTVHLGKNKNKKS